MKHVDGCIFCKVVRGEAPAHKVYEDERVLVFMDLFPVTDGHTLIVTNAAGGLNPEFRPGDLMLLRDHINLAGMAGSNPLFGPNDPTLGTRFPDMSQAYDPELRQIARQVAQEHGLPLHEGVYVWLAGPSFETPADIHFLRLIGVDAVGMSTVPEVTVARHGGIRVMGVSGISNVAPTESDSELETSHEEVLAAGQEIVPRLIALLLGVLAQLKAG